MGIIAQVLDRYTSKGPDKLNWTWGTWRQDDFVCIMGAIGLVLQDGIFSIANDYMDGDELGAFVNSYNFSPEECREIWALFTTVVEQYPDYFQNVRCDATLIPLPWRPWNDGYNNGFPSLLAAVISTLVTWNDHQELDEDGNSSYRSEEEIVTVLEKTALRIAETV